MDKGEDRTYSRLGYLIYFIEIACDSYASYQEYMIKLKEIEAAGGFWHNGHYVYNQDEEHWECQRALAKEVIKMIVFIPIFLEAYIYDLAAIVLGDTYAKRFLDKLDLISKWIIIPKLITQKELDRSKAYFSTFRALVSARNQLVHHKTKNNLALINQMLKEGKKELPDMLKKFPVDDLLPFLKDLFQDLDEIDPKGHHQISLEMYMGRQGIRLL